MRPSWAAVPLLTLALVACSSSGSGVRATPAPTPSPTPSLTASPTATPTHHSPGPNRPTEHIVATPTRATTAVATPAPATTRTSAAQPPAALCHLRSQPYTIDGRTVIVDVPGRLPAPVVIDFHGGNQSATQEHAYTGLGVFGAGQGYIVATPNGTNGLWNFTGSEAGLPNDVGFTQDIAAFLGLGGCSNGRIYTAGISDGADMAVAAACAVPSVRAVFAVAPSITPRVTCTKKSYLEVHGNADPIVPYSGSGAGSFADTPSEPVASRLPFWTSGCGASVPGIQPAAGTVVQTWTCAGRTASLYTVAGGGHTWPGAPGQEPVAGLGMKAIWSADSVALNFFSQN